MRSGFLKAVRLKLVWMIERVYNLSAGLMFKATGTAREPHLSREALEPSLAENEARADPANVGQTAFRYPPCSRDPL